MRFSSAQLVHNSCQIAILVLAAQPSLLAPQTLETEQSSRSNTPGIGQCGSHCHCLPTSTSDRRALNEARPSPSSGRALSAAYIPGTVYPTTASSKHAPGTRVTYLPAKSRQNLDPATCLLEKVSKLGPQIVHWIVTPACDCHACKTMAATYTGARYFTRGKLIKTTWLC